MKPRTPLQLLLVEDSPGDAGLLRELIAEEALVDIAMAQVASMSEAERHPAGTAGQGSLSWCR